MPVMLGVRCLVVVVVLSRFTEELSKGGDVHGLWSFPFAAGEPLLDFLKLPAVPVRILERGEREIGTAFRVAPGDTRFLHRVVERAAGVMEDLTGVDAAADQLFAGGVDIFDGEDQLRRSGRRRGDALAEDDRGVGLRRSKLESAKILIRDVI